MGNVSRPRVNAVPCCTPMVRDITLDRHRMPELSKKDKLRLLTIMLESRHADLREQNLNRQGKGHFHVSGMGHEALAAISVQMDPGDYVVPFYRDRGLVLGRGMTTQQLALEYFAKPKTASAAPMMP